jgi:hypothetical protein
MMMYVCMSAFPFYEKSFDLNFHSEAKQIYFFFLFERISIDILTVEIKLPT